MRLAALEVALAVARLKSFAGAARELNMSTTAVSRTIATLEEQLGVRLFNRTTRSTAVTAAGARLVSELAPSLAAVAHALARTRTSGDEHAGTLRINTSVQGAVHIVPFVAAFVKQHAAVNIELSTERQLIDIVRAGFDAGIRSRDAVPKDMVRVPLGGSISLVIIASPEYIRAHGTPSSLRDLADHRCIRYLTGTTEHRWEVTRGRRDITVRVDGPLAVDEYHLAYEGAKAGIGLAMLPRWLVARDLAAGRLIQALPNATPESAPLCLYYPAGRNLPPLLRAFAQHLRTALPRS
jgi:DNA-binding transcriptional LysR family regulator